jgi:hypothetical protein
MVSVVRRTTSPPLHLFFLKRLKINQECESFEVSNPVKAENKLAGKYI